jgi:hypothetical protein
MFENWRQSLIWVLRANLIFLTVDLVLLAFLVLFLHVDAWTVVKDGYFSIAFLLDTGVIFLAGGFVAMSSSIFVSKVREYVLHSDEKWSEERDKMSQKKANLYILTGVLLFLESLVSGLLFS